MLQRGVLLITCVSKKVRELKGSLYFIIHFRARPSVASLIVKIVGASYS